MTLRLEIVMENAAFFGGEDGESFCPGPEVGRLLRKYAADCMEQGGALREVVLRDINGNAVGTVALY